MVDWWVVQSFGGSYKVSRLASWWAAPHWDITPLHGERRWQRLLSLSQYPGGSTTQSDNSLSVHTRVFIWDVNEWNDQAQHDHIAFELTTGFQAYRRGQGHAETLHRFVSAASVSVSSSPAQDMDWPPSRSGWFDGAAQSHDAAQVSASGAAGIRSGHVLLGESDPEAGGVQGKARWVEDASGQPSPEHCRLCVSSDGKGNVNMCFYCFWSQWAGTAI